MSEYLITYELHKPGQNYESLWKSLKNMNAKRIKNSVWLLSSNYSLSIVYDILHTFIDSNDKLTIVEFNNIKSTEHVLDTQIKILEKKLHGLGRKLSSTA